MNPGIDILEFSGAIKTETENKFMTLPKGLCSKHKEDVQHFALHWFYIDALISLKHDKLGLLRQDLYLLVQSPIITLRSKLQASLLASPIKDFLIAT